MVSHQANNFVNLPLTLPNNLFLFVTEWTIQAENGLDK